MRKMMFENARLVREIVRKNQAYKLTKEPTTHDYFTRRSWGHDYTIHKIIDSGMKLELSGWGRGIEVGDILKLKNGNSSTHYIVDKIEYYNDPKDMWSAEASFAGQ